MSDEWRARHAIVIACTHLHSPVAQINIKHASVCDATLHQCRAIGSAHSRLVRVLEGVKFPQRSLEFAAPDGFLLPFPRRVAPASFSKPVSGHACNGDLNQSFLCAISEMCGWQKGRCAPHIRGGIRYGRLWS